jgi:hypothetical protein
MHARVFRLDSMCTNAECNSVQNCKSIAFAGSERRDAIAISSSLTKETVTFGGTGPDIVARRQPWLASSFRKQTTKYVSRLLSEASSLLDGSFVRVRWLVASLYNAFVVLRRKRKRKKEKGKSATAKQNSRRPFFALKNHTEHGQTTTTTRVTDDPPRSLFLSVSHAWRVVRTPDRKNVR